MEEKIFDLLTEMYAEMRKGFKDIDMRFEKAESDINELKNDVLRIENTMINNDKALFDGYRQIYEKQQEHDKRFDTVERKIDDMNLIIKKHDVEIRIIKEAK